MGATLKQEAFPSFCGDRRARGRGGDRGRGGGGQELGSVTIRWDVLRGSRRESIVECSEVGSL